MDISDLSSRQIANALVIFAAAIPFGADAVKAALMTAAAESSYLRYANDGSYDDQDHEAIWRWYGDHFGGQRNLPLAVCQQIYSAHLRQSLSYTHDAVAGSALTTKDSLGHYQQREMYGYGPVADLMDPAESTRIFLRGVPGDPMKVRHWSRTDKPTTLTIAQACQWVQGSEFPTGENYAPMEPVADQLIAHFGGLPQTKDWWSEMTASNWDEAKAELDNTLRPLIDNVQALYDDNKLDGFPFGKQAAGFNDLRDLATKVQWLVDNETIPVDPADASKGNYPFTKTAASFNDIRALAEKVDALTAAVTALTPKQ